MAQAGRKFPFFFLRDWNPQTFMGRDRLPWRYKFVGGIARPGPFNGWAGKTVIGSEPDVDFATRTTTWRFAAPPGADPTTSIELTYRLKTDGFWYVFGGQYLISGVKAVDGAFGVVGTPLAQVFGPSPAVTYSPPWPGAVPWFGPSGDFRAATWADLGVTQYPGRWPL